MADFGLSWPHSFVNVFGEPFAGLVFVSLPWDSSVVVLPTPAWLLPGPSNVVQVTSPCTRLQLSGSGAANAGTATDKTRRATASNITMRLIKMFLSLATSGVC